MQNALTTASETRRNEWARVNALLPWDQAPEWARFAFVYGGLWYWCSHPVRMVGKDGIEHVGEACCMDEQPRILTDEHLFRRPGPARTPSGITRLLQANVPVQMAGRLGLKSNPEREALLAYADIMEAARARFGVAFEEVVRDAIK